MAYAAVASLMLTLQQILQHPQRCSIPCDREHVESFQKKLQFLRLFLEEHPSTKSNEQVSSLERRIRDAAYEADDFFMDGHLIVSRRSSSLVRTIRDVAYEADEFFMDGHLIVSRRSSSKEKMGQVNIEVMMKNVDSMIEEVRKIKGQIGLEIIRGRGPSMELEGIKIGEVRNHGDFQHRSALRKDSSGLVSSDRNNLMVGFDSHLVQIKDQITGQSSALEVVSIVGMGGIGKSTLATNVYNDPYVVNHFDVRAWATVSQSYDVREILLGMLDSMKILTEKMYRESDDQLGLHVYQNLKHRRYLVIIDDIWDTDAWDYLKMKFPDDENGSRIMLTTRIADVAAYASPSETLHQISLLSDDQSWELLCAKVFGDEPCPLSLQEIGKTIAQNCGGLPLSIVVIGGLLSKVEKTQMAWQPVAENVTSFVFSSDDRCSDILRLSYNYLPHYLKPCFLYLGVFPKAYEICVSKLIQMWVAEGFLRQVHGQSLEEVAERCIENLLDRSLILMSKKDYQGKISVFRIHDLLFDFCLKEAKDEKFLLVTPRTSACEHRISIHSKEEFEHCQSHLDSMSSPSYVHSLFFFQTMLFYFPITKIQTS